MTARLRGLAAQESDREFIQRDCNGIRVTVVGRDEHLGLGCRRSVFNRVGSLHGILFAESLSNAHFRQRQDPLGGIPACLEIFIGFVIDQIGRQSLLSIPRERQQIEVFHFETIHLVGSVKGKGILLGTRGDNQFRHHLEVFASVIRRPVGVDEIVMVDLSVKLVGPVHRVREQELELQVGLGDVHERLHVHGIPQTGFERIIKAHEVICFRI